MRKPLDYYHMPCPKHPDRVYIKAMNVEGALCEVLPFNGQSAEENAMGLILLLHTFGEAISSTLREQEGGAPCDEAQRD